VGRKTPWISLGLLGLASACGGRAEVFGAPPGACGAVSAAEPLEGAGHVPNCYPLSFESNPPSSGAHYENWAAHGVYPSPLPRGFWVHNLEHGAIVLTYNCDDGCPDEVARAEQLMDELPPDASCPGGRRVLLVPDPLLDVRWAASAWGYTLRADCFDPGTFLGFYVQHYAKAPEDVCSEGVELRQPDGSLDLPPGCGQ